MTPGIGLIAKKLGMTQVFREDGRPVPVTVLEAGPCTVVQSKTVKKDGYRAVQLGFDAVDAKELRKPQAGHFAKAKTGTFKVLREFRLPAEAAKPAAAPAGDKEQAPDEFAVGSTLTVELFKAGDRIDITGTSVGLGFQGGVKRWHWKGGKQTHGSMSHRRPGSIGSSTNPSRVFKGHHLPGRMGNDRITTQAMEIVRVDASQNLLLVKGAVPGYEEALVLIRKSRKGPKIIRMPAVKKRAAKAPVAKAAAPAAAKPAEKGKK